MAPLLILLYLLGGAALLILGAEALVRGASRLASIVGISSLAIGLTVVAFGTSSPELSVSAYQQHHSLAWFSTILLVFVIPLSVVTLGIFLIRSLRS